MKRSRAGSKNLSAGLGLACVALLASACTSPRFGQKATEPPHAFIAYHPPPEGSTGLRLAVKDLIDIEGQVTTAGSRYLAETSAPAERDAKCLRIARERGVTIVGKANLSEFATGVSGMNDYFGTPENPVTPKRNRMPGGSSSGSAVAVALGMADVALGTDTAGSVRAPAASCGIAGLKTTYGLVSLEGVYPISPDHLDTVGPMARDVGGLVEGMDLLENGFRAKFAAARAAKPSPGAVRVGRLYVPGTDPAIDRAIDDVLFSNGFQVYRMSERFLEEWKQAEADGNAMAAAGAYQTNRDKQIRRRVSFRAKSAIALGSLTDRTVFEAAVERKPDWQRTLRQVFRGLDVIALPVLNHPPFKIPIFDEPAVTEARVLAMQNTAAVNYAGNPALALPVPMIEDGAAVPFTSIQLVGPPGSEAQLLNVGRLIESK
ncbi:amidase [soil metagenome]